MNRAQKIPSEAQEFIRQVLACKEDFPKLAMIGQAMLETGWLKHKIGKYNLFGIKYMPSVHKRYLLQRTTEYFSPEELRRWSSDPKFPDRRVVSETAEKRGGRTKYVVIDYFADFETLDEAIADYLRIIKSPRYKSSFDAWLEHRDWRRFLRDIGPKYATAPNYAETAIRVAETVQREMHDAV